MYEVSLLLLSILYTIVMYVRQTYLDKILEFKDKEPIKIITGVRRSGKSVILRQFCSSLLKETSADHVIYLDFESIENTRDIHTYTDLYNFVRSKISDKKRYYILLDEIPLIEGWQKTVVSLKSDIDFDLYITGSNSKMLSSDLVTVIAGRYVQIQVSPLSFKEYYEATGATEVKTSFNTYLKEGGFPGLLEYDRDSDSGFAYMHDVFNSIIVRDILQHNSIRDLPLLKAVIEYLADNTGNEVSIQKLANYLKTAKGRKYPAVTLKDYVRMCTEVFLVEPIDNADIRGKERLVKNQKYYIVDSGMRNVILSLPTVRDFTRVLETVVFAYLKQNSRIVKRATAKTGEVDFFVSTEKDCAYYQVCMSVELPEVLQREEKALLSVQDAFPKYLLVYDAPIPSITAKGVRILPLMDFLLGKVPL